MTEETVRQLIKILMLLKKNISVLSKKYGLYFIIWMIFILLIQSIVFSHVKLEAVIFTLLAISLLLSYVTEKIMKLIKKFI